MVGYIHTVPALTKLRPPFIGQALRTVNTESIFVVWLMFLCSRITCQSFALCLKLGHVAPGGVQQTPWTCCIQLINATSCRLVIRLLETNRAATKKNHCVVFLT